jgi:flagella basal body P-ring formation protein FlgA
MIRFPPMLLAALASPTLAQGFADLDEVDRQVSAFAGQPAPPVDRRLRLAHCAAPLALDWYGAARQAVQVRCPTVGGWSLYVSMPAAAASATPLLIQRGDSVTIQVGGEGWAVSQPGEALEPGAAGMWIKVRGIAPKAPVLRGRVLRPGLVGVDLP